LAFLQVECRKAFLFDRKFCDFLSNKNAPRGTQGPVDLGFVSTETEWRMHTRAIGRRRKRPRLAREFRKRNSLFL